MAAASMKLSLAHLRPPALRSVDPLVVVSSKIRGADKVADCSTVRCFQGGYITCDNYPGKQLDGCACVCAPENGRNCVLHPQYGSPYNCSKNKE